MSANNGSPPNSALVAELSFSFQDELTATIHNALGVAVEIAVVEITKLVGQVLRDVRDQMHETLRDNKSLKFRLQTAELELCAMRGRLEEQRQVPTVTVSKPSSITSRIQQVHQQLSSLTDCSQNTMKTRRHESHRDGESNSEQADDAPLDVKERYNDFAGSAETDDNAYRTESFCEIREDGRVCTHDIKPDLMGESTQHELEETAVSKQDPPSIHSGDQTDKAHFNQACATGQDASRVLPDGQPLAEAAPKVPKVDVKVEATDLVGCGSATGSYAGREEDFGSDSLSLAQSRMLEDWRPDPLQLQNCDTDPFTPSTSHSLADSPIFSADIPDLDLLSPSAPGHLAPFPKPYPPRDTGGPSLSGTTPPQLYPPQPTGSNNPPATQHVCKVCGQAFPRMEELRKHRSLLHPKNLNKSPKRSLFPPGRSPYHCALCGRDFNRMEHLKIHQRIHTGERPYACSVCNARFRHSWALTRHFRIHTGEKPYACGQCGKTFRNCGGLRFHQRSHAMGGLV